MLRKYPNREALMKISEKVGPMFAAHLQALDTSTEIGQKIALGLPWLFTETEVQVVSLERLLNAPEYRGQHPGVYVEDLMTSLNIPRSVFMRPLSSPQPNNREWTDDIPQGMKSGAKFIFEGIEMMVILNISDEYLITAPADMVLYCDSSMASVAR
jgi:hypothetical protein